MKWSPRAIAFSAMAIVIAAFIGLMAIGLANKNPVTGLSGATRLNKPAPVFAADSFNGDRLDLAAHLGKPIVVNFWASWCAPCRQEAPILEGAWRTYGRDGVLFVGVNMQDADQVAREYLKEFDITYPNVMDPDGRITVDYGVIGIPVTFFVNKDGIVERRHVGAIGAGQLAAWVEEMIAGFPPSGDAQQQNPDGYFPLP